jgi:hypothetical protein
VAHLRLVSLKHGTIQTVPFTRLAAFGDVLALSYAHHVGPTTCLPVGKTRFLRLWRPERYVLHFGSQAQAMQSSDIGRTHQIYLLAHSMALSTKSPFCTQLYSDNDLKAASGRHHGGAPQTTWPITAFVVLGFVHRSLYRRLGGDARTPSELCQFVYGESAASLEILILGASLKMSPFTCFSSPAYMPYLDASTWLHPFPTCCMGVGLTVCPASRNLSYFSTHSQKVGGALSLRTRLSTCQCRIPPPTCLSHH